MNKKLLQTALLGKTAAEFSATDVNKNAIEEILAECGLRSDMNVRKILAHKSEIFAIISEVIDEILPKDVQNIMGAYAEVKNFKRDDEVVFQLKTGYKRAKLSIVKGARGGVYKAARIDNKLMDLDVDTWTVGVYVTLEDIILGNVTLGELYSNLLAGFEEKIYEETVVALRTAATVAPGSHHISAAGVADDNLDKLIRIAKAYGDNVVIVGFQSAIAKINNVVTLTETEHKLPTEDLTDIRNTGFVKLYKGTPIVELQNFILTDGATANFAFKEGDIFILPGASKPVKVAFKGDSYMVDEKLPGGAEQWNEHKMAGVGLLLADDVCILTDTGITGGEY